MMRRRTPAANDKRAAALVAALAAWATPGAARADLLPPAFYEAIAPLPNVLLTGAQIWAAASLALAAHAALRLWRRTGAARRKAVWDLAAGLCFAPLPWLAVRQIADAAAAADRLASLGVAALWLLVALPALVAAPTKGVVRWKALGWLAAGDLLAGVLIVRGLAGGRAALSPWPLVGFAALLHLAAFAHLLPRGAERRGLRWAAFLAAAFFAADFFAPPAAALAGRPLPQLFARVVPSRPARFQQAFLNAEGDRAWALDRAGGRLYEVELATGRTRLPLPPDTPPIAALAISPDRKLLAVAHAAGAALRLQVLDAAGRARAQFRGGVGFAPTTALVGDRYAFAAGEGAKANFLQCPQFLGDAGAGATVEQVCRETSLPLKRIGALAATPGQGLVYAAEGDRWLAEGRRLLVTETESGALLRWTPLAYAVGETRFDALEPFLYLARPTRGGIDKRSRDDLRRIDWFELAPGANWPTVDARRGRIVAASARTGYLLVYDTQRRKMAARLPIGEGITHLDCLPARGLALACAARGLIAIKLDDLPGLTPGGQ